MLDHDLLDAEKEAQNKPLISDLTRYFDTPAEDRASLASIRARLLQKTAIALPVADPAEETKLPTPLPLHRAKNAGTKLIKRHPYLNALVAACLLVVLIGSFAFVINRPFSAGSTTPAVVHGWSILKTFSGTGNRTIDGLDIAVGHSYGWLIDCTNTSVGEISVSVNDSGSDIGNKNCGSGLSVPLAPENFTKSQNELPPISTIQVTAVGTISWKLWLFKGVYYPPLNIFGPEFQPLHAEMDGTGNSTIVLDVTIPAAAWHLGFECHGTGTFGIGLWSNTNSAIADITDLKNEPCNGQPNGDLRGKGYLQGTVIHQIRIKTGSENDWQVILGGCTNDLLFCGISPD